VNVLVVAAHPDDEVLGCGGTLARLSREKNRVTCCFMSESVKARHIKPEHSKFLRNIKRAHRRLGVSDVIFNDFPNIEMNTVPTLRLVKAVEDAILRVKPQMILTHHWADVNEDHVRTFEAVVAAARLPERGRGHAVPRNMIKKILCFEIPSSTDWSAPAPHKTFTPNVFFNIERTLPAKIAALKEYHGVIRPFPHPCSPEGLTHLAAYRGMQSGFERAEAFFLLRETNI
jgi:N-acetylglucosamine malate deacetylase 1